MPVCITLNSIDCIQEVWQAEQNYACPLVYHCHQSQLFLLGYGSSIQIINTSPVQGASNHPRNSTVHTSGVTQFIHILQVTSHIALMWLCISVGTALSKQQIGYEIANDHSGI